jgi:hypothetical protein
MAYCDNCGQECMMSDAWTVRGLCDDCRAVRYGGDERHEPVKLFEPAPEQLEGQLSLDA